MNVFYVDYDPIQAAKDLPWKLVVKMPLEGVQILAASFHHRGWNTKLPKNTHLLPSFATSVMDSPFSIQVHKFKNLKVTKSYKARSYSDLSKQLIIRDTYKVTHEHHPSVTWMDKDIANLAWVCAHTLALARQYRQMYGKTHGSEWPAIIARYEILDRTGASSLEGLYRSHTPPPQAMFPELWENYRGHHVPHTHSRKDSRTAYRRYMHSKPYVKDVNKAWTKGTKPPYWWDHSLVN